VQIRYHIIYHKIITPSNPSAHFPLYFSLAFQSSRCAVFPHACDFMIFYVAFIGYSGVRMMIGRPFERQAVVIRLCVQRAPLVIRQGHETVALHNFHPPVSFRIQRFGSQHVKRKIKHYSYSDLIKISKMY